jgi:hypothetical protein
MLINSYTNINTRKSLVRNGLEQGQLSRQRLGGADVNLKKFACLMGHSNNRQTGQ